MVEVDPYGPFVSGHGIGKGYGRIVDIRNLGEVDLPAENPGQQKQEVEQMAHGDLFS